MNTLSPHANNSGHEPWARAAVGRGEKLTTEMGAELLASLDKARADLAHVQGLAYAHRWDNGLAGQILTVIDEQRVWPRFTTGGAR